MLKLPKQYEKKKQKKKLFNAYLKPKEEVTKRSHQVKKQRLARGKKKKKDLSNKRKMYVKKITSKNSWCCSNTIVF